MNGNKETVSSVTFQVSLFFESESVASLMKYPTNFVPVKKIGDWQWESE
jgi:hypothetical protein